MSSVFLTTKGQNKLLSITDPTCATVVPYTFKIGIGQGLNPLSTDLVAPVYGPALVTVAESISPVSGNKIRTIICPIPDDIGNYEITELGIWDKQGDMIIGVVYDPPISVKVDPTRYTQKYLAIPYYAIGIMSNLTLCVSANTVRYTHTQNNASAEWRIEHNLNRTEQPIVQATRFDGTRIEPTKIVHTNNITTLYFSQPESGIAVLVF